MTAPDAEPPTTDAPSIVVTGGGEPTPEQLAAVVLALTPVAGPDQAPEPDPVPRGWRRAALIEGVGGRPSASLPDLTSGRFGLGHIGDPTAHA